MITKITIENFKGIGERVEIPIRPLTMFFGPNSAGKSTILHAFHYAREIFERHNLDADRTIAGGDFIDLGGFKNFVHGHDVTNGVTLRFDLALPEDGFSRFIPDERALWGDPEIWQTPPRMAWVQVLIGSEDIFGTPTVGIYEVGIDGHEIGVIQRQMHNVALKSFNFEHPSFRHELEDDDSSSEAGPLYTCPVRDLWEEAAGHIDFTGRDYLFTIPGQIDALSPDRRCLELDWELDAEEEPVASAPDPESAPVTVQRRALLNLFSEVFVGVGDLLREELKRLCYVGPLRQKPPREYSPPRFPDPSRWATGMGAWDALYDDDRTLVPEVSAWLIREELLDTGYILFDKEYIELDVGGDVYANIVSGRTFDDIDNPGEELERILGRKRLVLAAPNNGLFLAIHDVGEGIGQVIPVIVAALQPTDSAAIVQIEQPELHLHPKQQAALGDLLIQGALGNEPKSMLIETHSEHLILRVLRRIRQTAKGQLSPETIPVTPSNVAVYYMQSKDGQTKLMQIDVDDQGEFVQPWPDDFFEIDFHERFA